MGAKTKKGQSSLRRVSQGLYRSSATDSYFAHVRIHGKLFRESLKTTDFALAKRKLAEFRQRKERIDPGAGRFTLETLCDHYLSTITHLSPSSVKAKTGIVTRLKSEWPEGANVPVSAIRPSHCEAWLAGQGTHVGKSHLNAYLQVLKDVFLLATRDRILAENPADHLHYQKRERPIRLTPTWEDFKAIVNCIRTQRLNATAEDSADFVEFLGCSGLGNAEAASLKWQDVDWARGRIRTYRHKTDQGFVIPLYPELRPLLEKLRGDRPDAPNEQVLKIKDAKKALSGACKRLNLPNYTHRAFRRMFITRALEKGIDVKVVSEWQGHRDGGKLILDTYSHVNRAHADRMATLMKE